MAIYTNVPLVRRPSHLGQGPRILRGLADAKLSPPAVPDHEHPAVAIIRLSDVTRGLPLADDVADRVRKTADSDRPPAALAQAVRAELPADSPAGLVAEVVRRAMGWARKKLADAPRKPRPVTGAGAALNLRKGGDDSAEAAMACFRAAYDRDDLKMGPARGMSTSELAEWLADGENKGGRIEAGRTLSKASRSSDMEKGAHFLDEDKAQAAHKQVVDQYGLTEKDGDRYWRLKTSIYQKMGGAFEKSGAPWSQVAGTPAGQRPPAAASPPPPPPPVSKPHHHAEPMQFPTKPTKRHPPPSHPKETKAPLAVMSSNELGKSEAEHEIPAFMGRHLRLRASLAKGAGHKYIRRVPKPGGGYRYFYKVSGGQGGVGHDSEFHVGAAFRMKDAGQEGHFHVTGRDPDGLLTIKHDETGTTHRLAPAALSAMLHAEHAEALGAHRAKLASDIADANAAGASEKQKARLRAEAEKFGVEAPPAAVTDEELANAQKAVAELKTKAAAHSDKLLALDSARLRAKGRERTKLNHERGDMLAESDRILRDLSAATAVLDELNDRHSRYKRDERDELDKRRVNATSALREALKDGGVTSIQDENVVNHIAMVARNIAGDAPFRAPHYGATGTPGSPTEPRQRMALVNEAKLAADGILYLPEAAKMSRLSIEELARHLRSTDAPPQSIILGEGTHPLDKERVAKFRAMISEAFAQDPNRKAMVDELAALHIKTEPPFASVGWNSTSHRARFAEEYKRIDQIEEALGRKNWQRMPDAVRNATGMSTAKHREAVKTAALAGKPVPADVLAAHPGLSEEIAGAKIHAAAQAERAEASKPIQFASPAPPPPPASKEQPTYRAVPRGEGVHADELARVSRVVAAGKTFDAKDDLRNAGFKWDSYAKEWVHNSPAGSADRLSALTHRLAKKGVEFGLHKSSEQAARAADLTRAAAALTK